jgi:hypothetical protein
MLVYLPEFIKNKQNVLRDLIELDVSIEQIKIFVNELCYHIDGVIYDITLYVLNQFDYPLQESHTTDFIEYHCQYSNDKHAEFNYSLFHDDYNPTIHAIQKQRADIVEFFMYDHYVFNTTYNPTPFTTLLGYGQYIVCDETTCDSVCKIIRALYNSNCGDDPLFYEEPLKEQFVYKALKNHCEPVIDLMFEIDKDLFEKITDVNNCDDYEDILKMLYEINPNYIDIYYIFLHISCKPKLMKCAFHFLAKYQMIDNEIIISLVYSLIKDNFNYKKQQEMVTILKAMNTFYCEFYPSLIDMNIIFEQINFTYILNKIENEQFYSDILCAIYRICLFENTEKMLSILKAMDETIVNSTPFKLRLNEEYIQEIMSREFSISAPVSPMNINMNIEPHENIEDEKIIHEVVQPFQFSSVESTEKIERIYDYIDGDEQRSLKRVKKSE